MTEIKGLKLNYSIAQLRTEINQCIDQSYIGDPKVVSADNIVADVLDSHELPIEIKDFGFFMLATFTYLRTMVQQELNKRAKR